MFVEWLLRPSLHGAAGPWDEIINLIPLVVGGALLFYLYKTSRKPRPGDDDASPAGDEPER
jgi:hypothetical protein